MEFRTKQQQIYQQSKLKEENRNQYKYLTIRAAVINEGPLPQSIITRNYKILITGISIGTVPISDQHITKIQIHNFPTVNFNKKNEKYQ